MTTTRSSGIVCNIYQGGTRHFQRVLEGGVEMSGRFPYPRRGGCLGRQQGEAVHPARTDTQGGTPQTLSKSFAMWKTQIMSTAGYTETHPMLAHNTSSRLWCAAWRKPQAEISP